MVTLRRRQWLEVPRALAVCSDMNREAAGKLVLRPFETREQAHVVGEVDVPEPVRVRGFLREHPRECVERPRVREFHRLESDASADVADPLGGEYLPSAIDTPRAAKHSSGGVECFEDV